jgi:quinol monooxygenase YgiN
MIVVLAEIEVVDGQRESFLAEFHRLMPLVHAEVGCIEYAPTVDIPTEISVQAALRPLVVTIVEKWESVDALKAHLVAPHMHDYRLRVKNFVKGVTIRVLEYA